MKHPSFVVAVVLLLICSVTTGEAASLSSPNVPLDSPVYLYLEKLSGFGVVRGDFKGIRPYSRSEVARLLQEAEGQLEKGDYPPLARALLARVRELVPREAALRATPSAAPPFDFNPFSNARLRYVYLDGAPRSYERPLYDAGGDWIFPLPQSRVHFPYPRIFDGHGTEGTPLMDHSEGISHRRGSSLEGRFSGELYGGSWLSAVAEPLFFLSDDDSYLRVNKAYLKLGGGALELEVGRDANWLGLGYRGNVILTDNARNLTQVKLSSPEPVDWRWFWDFKYDLLFSQLDRVETVGGERQPYFYAFKFSMKPTQNVEWGLNLGRQVGGPGVDGSSGAILKGIIGAANEDDSNTLAGMELRWRLPWLWNIELYGEFNGEDRSDFWPQADSYVAGLFIPRIGREGRDDLRFEYFYGHPLLYTSGTFPEGYLYHGFPLGHQLGGGTEDFFLRYSHWFSVRNIAALDGSYTTRGEDGRVWLDASGAVAYAGTGRYQSVERKYAVRALWRLPLYGEWDADLMYGWERVKNVDLVEGASRTNQVVRIDLSYRY